MCKHILIKDFNNETDFLVLDEFIQRSTHENDGYGAIIRTTTNKLITRKSLDTGSFYLELGTMLQSGMVKDLVVHHRMSTNKPGIDYAHPFEFQGNYMTHNGVVHPFSKHDTKTENDSEWLLHHLIKTDFKTNEVSGYYSCFILNESSTIIVVDGIAPIFSFADRIYSSHNLVEGMTKIEKKKIVMSLDGNIMTSDIEVVISTYGNDKKALSLGNGKWYDQREWVYEDDGYSFKSDYEKFYKTENDLEYFYDFLSTDDERLLKACRNQDELRVEIEFITETLDLKLTPDEMTQAISYFTSFEYNERTG